jgi:hypothetical protein
MVFIVVSNPNIRGAQSNLGYERNYVEFQPFQGRKRLTLKDNPHFYEKLPASAEKYEGQFRTDPIETFQHDKISVLTDNPRLTGRVFLETAKEKRAFGNVWVPKEAIIFTSGKRESPTLTKVIQPTQLDVNLANLSNSTLIYYGSHTLS